MPDAPPPTSTPPETQSPQDDSLAHLFKMSTTSAGGQEYVAINATSIASVLIGVASVLAFLANELLIVPLAGFVCAIVAIVQIRRSNGTQSGMAFALVGLVLALGIGGFKGGQQLIISHEDSKDSRVIADILQRLGTDLHSARYDEAYDDFFSPEFKREVDRKSFSAMFQQIQNMSEYGQVEYARWNGQRVEYEEVGTSGVKSASAMALVKFQKPATPARPIFVFSDRDGTWKIDECSFFPSKKKKKGASSDWR